MIIAWFCIKIFLILIMIYKTPNDDERGKIWWNPVLGESHREKNGRIGISRIPFDHRRRRMLGSVFVNSSPKQWEKMNIVKFGNELFLPVYVLNTFNFDKGGIGVAKGFLKKGGHRCSSIQIRWEISARYIGWQLCEWKLSNNRKWASNYVNKKSRITVEFIFVKKSGFA